jgi:hypothetical protein
MLPDGSGRVRLTGGRASPEVGTGDPDPAWSPDGATGDCGQPAGVGDARADRPGRGTFSDPVRPVGVGQQRGAVAALVCHRSKSARDRIADPRDARSSSDAGV